MAIPTAGPILKALLALSGGVVLFTFLLLAALTVFGIYNAGKVYPGVSVAGVNVSGLSPEEAAAKLSQHLSYPQTGKIVFQGEQAWIAKPADLGLYLDPQMNAWAAYHWGRQGNIFLRPFAQFKAWYIGIDLPPLMVYDQRVTSRYLNSIAQQVNRPTIEASLSVNGTDVTVTPGQVGRELDVQATLLPLEARFYSLTDGAIPLVINETPPVILDASAQAETARKILSAPLVLQISNAQEGDPGPWKLDPQALAGLLTITRVDNTIQVGLESGRLQTYLEGLAPDLARQPANARFIFNDESHQLEIIQHATIGRSLNVAASIQEIQTRLAQGEHNINLVFDITNPAVGDDATAEKLGITELVSVQASYFYGSSASRIQNIKAAAGRFHGLLVPPGATFSMGDALGDVSLDTGYAEALIIYGNRTIKGVGGGVCQVSTTLFRTAFFGGYPVVERYPHAYRVSYYEYTAGGNVDPDLAGLDATVFTPVVVFRFTNDTPSWLLMETYVNVEARKLTWKFYSTSDGRTVDWETTGLQNTVEPPEPLYQENPDLAQGEIRQVDWAAEGADVTVFRTVSRDGQVYFQDQFSTHYLPWRAVYEYGPGTNIKNNNE
jgi:vancomycin resistance protein YoaR